MADRHALAHAAGLTTAEVPSSEILAHVSRTAFDWLLIERASLRGSESGARLVELESMRDLRLDNYAGVLETPCGTRIEILSKAMEHGESIDAGRGVLQKMPTRCLDLKPRQSSPTALRTFDAPLLNG